MRRIPGFLLALVVLAAGGFAAAGIASGSSLVDVLTGTTPTTATVSTSTNDGEHGRRVTVCHHTHSQKHPAVTITVSEHAVAAHLRHHDTLGACTAADAQAGHGHGHDSGKGHDEQGTTTTTAATTGSTGDDDSSHGNGQNNGSGHGGGHGKNHK